MTNTDELMSELETHIERILEARNPDNQGAEVMDVKEHRWAVVQSLTRFVDQRIQERLTRFEDELARQAYERSAFIPRN